VARDLLGRHLVRSVEGSLLVARIVETEAYQQDDPASHSYRGRTPRTEVMFGPPGHLYVYFSYGMHWCMNVVTGDDGEGSAVLLRAAEPVEGLEAMRRRRGVEAERLLTSGPGRLTQALVVTRQLNGTDLVLGHALWIARGRPLGESELGVSGRVGIAAARATLWRFYDEGSPFLSRGPRVSSASATHSERGSPRERAREAETASARPKAMARETEKGKEGSSARRGA